ncbi:MAG: S1C family serine protease [Gammaproteobacteria bacterium]|nr:S1C family serine protease [Gammaproteobacteria bacterium]
MSTRARRAMRARRGLVRSLLLAAALGAPPTAVCAESKLDLDAVLAPVLALEATIAPDARSAATLGTVRGGTGVLIDASGLVLTVGYLIMEADAVELLPDGLHGPRLPADVVAWDPITGLGLVRAREPLDIEPMPLGDSSRLARDDAVIAASWDREHGVVPAVVVDRRTYAGYWEYLLDDALYVAPSHPAFPGAALIALDGTLAGIGAFAHIDAMDDGEVSGVVFIPIDALKRVLADLLLDGRSPERRPWLGLYCEETEGGLRVMRLPADGPAARVDIEPGDRVVSVAGVAVTTLPDLYRTLWRTTRPGDRVTLVLERGSRSLEIEIEAIDRHRD